MGRIKKMTKFAKSLEILNGILPMIFWGLILFSFEENFLAVSTLICALIHELGHVICILSYYDGSFTIKSVMNGFRIRSRRIKSYSQEIILYLSGPLANLLCFVICLASPSLWRR